MTENASSESADNDPSKNDTSKKALLRKARTSKRVSWILDELIRIPGTDIRFGLDPILGILPYGGETVATIIGATILGEAGKKGVPFRSLIKMGGNMLLNAIVGVIPFLGDAFSFWFKSNSRNYKMLNTYLDSDDGDQEPGGWGPLFIVFAIIGLVLLINVLAWFVLFKVLDMGLKEFLGA